MNSDQLVTPFEVDVACRAIGAIPANVVADIKAHKGLRLHQLQEAVAAAVRSSDPAAALRQHLAQWRADDGWATLRASAYRGMQ